jgi:hypothetical protein
MKVKRQEDVVQDRHNPVAMMTIEILTDVMMIDIATTDRMIVNTQDRHL